LTFVAIIIGSAPTISLTGETLTARGATIERKNLAEAVVIPKNEIFSALGPNLDARAWLAIQASVKGLVKVEIADPEDPTPYWLISTRNPEKLARMLND
jgi:hypothetical protein